MKKEEIDLNVDTNKKFVKRDYQRGLAEDEKPIPCSPVLGPITVLLNWFIFKVENPKIS